MSFENNFRTCFSTILALIYLVYSQNNPIIYFTSQNTTDRLAPYDIQWTAVSSDNNIDLTLTIRPNITYEALFDL